MGVPIRVPATLKFDGNGNPSASFGSPGVGYVWTGSIQVPGATPNSVLPVKFVVTASLAPLGTWYDDQPSGTIQVASGDILALTGAGLAPGTYTAYLVGSQDPAASAPTVWPQPTPAPPPGVPFALFDNQAGLGPIPAHTARTLFLSAPVVVGTGLEVTLIESSGNPFQLGLIWSQDPSSSVDIDSDFDIAGDGTGLWGWTTPNRGPVLTAVIRTGASPCTIQGQVLTGMPAVNLASLMTYANGILAAGSANVGANSSMTINLPPFIGPVYISGFANGGAAGSFHLSVNSTDYLKATTNEIGHWFAGAPSSFGFLYIAPQKFYLPPRWNTLLLNNSDAAAHGINYAVVAATPVGA